MKSFNYYHEDNLRPLNGEESIVREALMDATGFDLIKQFSPVEEQNVYWLIDLCGDKEGDYFTEFDDLVEYISNNDSVADAIADYQVSA